MLCRLLSAALGIALATGAASAADYRGMAPGWPTYANGGYANYAPAGYAAPGGYYAARPVTVAYANPNYLAAYGNARAAYRPTVAAAGYYQQPAAAYYPPQTAYYAPHAGQYAPQAAQYAPTTAQYAPSYSYAISPAGGSSAGSEAAAYYGQPTQLNYVPPQFSYRTNYAPVPVYAWRPVTAYDPVVGQQTTCLQPQTTSTCQPQRSRNWFSWLNPHNWFNRRQGSCGSPPPQTSYCTTNYCQPQCGTAQPYYPTQPNTIIQGVPAASQPPINLAPTYIPPASPRIPSPPTRVQPGTTIISPADSNPRIIPGQPSGIPLTPTPGSGFPSTTPGSGFPSTTPPASGGSFGTYPPSVDPYQGSQTAPPSTTIMGSGYRAPTSPKAVAPRTTTTTSDGPVIRAPELNSTVPPSVQTVPDLDAKQPVAPINRAPQLLSPRDKTATRGDERWAVVPAVWPSKPVSKVHSQVVQTKLTQPTPPAPAAPQANRYDDSGWSSGRAW